MKRVLAASLLAAYLVPGVVWAHDVSNFNETVHLMVMVGCVAPFVYFLPSIFAACAGHPRSNTIFLVNLLSGWSVIGWVAALVWAVLPTSQHAVVDDVRLSPAAGVIEQPLTPTIEGSVNPKTAFPASEVKPATGRKDNRLGSRDVAKSERDRERAN